MILTSFFGLLSDLRLVGMGGRDELKGFMENHVLVILVFSSAQVGVLLSDHRY